MPDSTTADELLATLRRVVPGQYSGKPLFFWQGSEDELHGLLDSSPELAPWLAWLDVNDLAEDVIPRRARETLRSKLQARLGAALEADRRILVVAHPYLLLRYEPAAPLAIFWNSFISSSRAVVVILPSPERRPELPGYVRYRWQDPLRLFGDAASAVAGGSTGGLHP